MILTPYCPQTREMKYMYIFFYFENIGQAKTKVILTVTKIHPQVTKVFPNVTHVYPLVTKPSLWSLRSTHIDQDQSCNSYPYSSLSPDKKDKNIFQNFENIYMVRACFAPQSPQAQDKFNPKVNLQTCGIIQMLYETKQIKTMTFGKSVIALFHQISSKLLKNRVLKVPKGKR